eukprot:ANDGO_02591.mRNA.1 hypothetical protein
MSAGFQSLDTELLSVHRHHEDGDADYGSGSGGVGGAECASQCDPEHSIVLLPKLRLLDFLFSLGGLAPWSQSHRTLSVVYDIMVVLCLIALWVLTLIALFMAKVNQVIFIYIVWSVFFTLNFILMRSVLRKSARKNAASTLSFLCRTQQERAGVERFANIFSVVLAVEVLLNAVLSFLVNTGFTDGHEVLSSPVFSVSEVILGSLLIVFSIPATLAWVAPTAVLFTSYMALTKIIQSIHTRHALDIVRLIAQVETVLPLIRHINIVFGPLLSVGCVFSGLTALVVAITFLRNVGGSAFFVVVLAFWLLASAFYIMVVLFIGSSVHRAVNNLFQDVIYSNVLNIESQDLLLKTHLLASLKRFETNCFAIQVLGLPITRTLFFRYVAVLASYVIVLLTYSTF